MGAILQRVIGVFIVALIAVSAAQAAPFARVVSKNSTSTVLELGDTNSLSNVNWLSADFQLNGYSFLPALLAGLGGPAAPFSIPDPNTIRIQVFYDLTPFAVRVKLCDLQGFCEDNSDRIPRHPWAPSATCWGVAPCAVGALAGLSSADWRPGNNWAVSIFEMTVDRPTLITEMEWLYTPGPDWLGHVYWNFMRPMLNIWSSHAALLANREHGDVVDWGEFTYEIPSGMFEQIGNTAVYKLPMKYTGLNGQTMLPAGNIMLYPGFTYYVAPFMYSRGEVAAFPMSLNVIPSQGDYALVAMSPGLIPLPANWVSRTLAADLIGVQQR